MSAAGMSAERYVYRAAINEINGSHTFSRVKSKTSNPKAKHVGRKMVQCLLDVLCLRCQTKNTLSVDY